jgi:dGTP triphosphohydrolase
VPEPIAQYNASHDLWLSTHSSLESQVAAIADDIAYNTHDIDDGLRSGLITLEMLEELPLISRLLAEVRDRYPGLEEPRLIHEVMRRQITRMVEDVIGVPRRTFKRSSRNRRRCASCGADDGAFFRRVRHRPTGTSRPSSIAISTAIPM